MMQLRDDETEAHLNDKENEEYYINELFTRKNDSIKLSDFGAYFHYGFFAISSGTISFQAALFYAPLFLIVSVTFILSMLLILMNVYQSKKGALKP